MTDPPRSTTTRRPWWKHPAFVVVVLALVLGGVALLVWLARPDDSAVAEIDAEGPDTVQVGEPFEVTATAVDDGGAPVSGEELSLSSEPALAKQPQDAAVTNDDGAVTFAGLEAEEAADHTLTVSTDGTAGQVRVEAVEPEGRIHLTAPSEVAEGEEFTVNVTFFRSGEPAEAEPLTVSVEPDGPVERVETDDNGTAQATFSDGVPEAGEYTLLAMSTDGRAERSQTLVVTGPTEPLDFQGDTGRTTDPFNHPGGLARFEYRHEGEEPFTVDVRTAEGRSVGTLVEAEGPASGSRYLGLDEGRYVLEVEADASWQVRYSAPIHEIGDALPVSYEGEGPTAVEPPFEVDEGEVNFEYRHGGEENFVVEVVDAETGDVAATVADSSGETDGTTEEELDAGIYVLDVQADGEWTVTAD